MRVGPLLLPLLVIQLAAANDLYAALGVSRNADSRAIKKAYRKMALQNHPDKQASLSDEQKKAATADFVAASNAYEVLSDPEKRRLYDRHGEAGLEAGGRPAHRSGAAGFGSGRQPRSEVFEAMFGTRRGSGGAFGGSGRGGTAFMGSRGNMYRQAGGAAAKHEEERARISLLAYLRAQQRRQEQLQEQQRQWRQQQARQYQQQQQQQQQARQYHHHQQQQARQYQQQAAQADAERQARQAVFDAEARAHAEAQAERRASKPKGGTGRRRAKLPRSQVLDL